MKVLKFGGTSVSSASRMKKVGELVLQNSQPIIVVLSAFSGTTNTLIELIKSEKENQKTILKDLKSHYLLYLRELFQENYNYELGEDCVNYHFGKLKGYLEDTEANEKNILAIGEQISNHIFSIYLHEIGHQNILLRALDFMKTDENLEPDYPFIQEKLKAIIKENSEQNIFVCPGFICKNHLNEVDNLNRGGSDYTATIIATVLEANSVEIWTDIDGMQNNDPRFIENTQPIRQLNYNEASELAYFGAKILHPSCIRPVQKAKIPVVLKNTLFPSEDGTKINGVKRMDGIRAIAAKDDISVIKIRSDRMLNTYGFLRKVFEIFENFKTPIDMITTSEVAVSLTIDNRKYLDEICEELSRFSDVEIQDNQSIVCVVGNFSAEKTDLANQVISALKNIPIRMISYGGSSYNMSILVETSKKKDALVQLHKALF
jgi:aspartate kinase